jgi:hypothetical protein
VRVHAREKVKNDRLELKQVHDIYRNRRAKLPKLVRSRPASADAVLAAHIVLEKLG